MPVGTQYLETESEWEGMPVGGGMPVSYEQFISNVRQNCKLDLPNIKAVAEHDRTMVMICGGPTAKLYVDEIRKKSKDPKYDVFCSNKTHDWLIQNDIVPYVQFIIDPKKSKVDDVQNPHKDVHYMIGVQCDPAVFESLKDYNVSRVLTYCNIKAPGKSVTDTDIVKAFFDDEEYAPLDGGTMAGLRAMNLGRILGYLTVEFYGFDSCFFDYDEKGNPIYYSYKKPRAENILEVECEDGRKFDTSPVFASQARQFIKWKHNLEWMKFIVHGDSFTAHLNKLDDEKLKPKHDLLFSEYHLERNKQFHEELKKEKKLGLQVHDKDEQDDSFFKGGKMWADYKGYGATGHEYAPVVSMLAGQLVKNFGSLTLLDYGCGEGLLAKALPPITGLEVKQYDFAIEEYSQMPEPADIVVCTDVLEHVEPDCLENVLDHLERLTKKVAFVAVSTREAQKYFLDGQNCHLIVQDYNWWYPKLRKRFDVIEGKIYHGDKFLAVLQSKKMRGKNGYSRQN